MNKIKLIISTILLIVYCVNIQGQNNTIAKIKYEQAEEAFLKDDFISTLAKLDEVEKLLGNTNPKVLYLKIVAQSKLIEQDPLKDYNIIVKARKNCDYYLTKYEKFADIEEKYRDVYSILEMLNDKYPKTEVEWKAKKEFIQNEIQKEIQKANQKILDENLKTERFVDSICAVWNWKSGLTFGELLIKAPKRYTNLYYNKKTNIYETIFISSAGKAIHAEFPDGRLKLGDYQYTSIKSYAKTKDQFEKIRVNILTNVPSTFILENSSELISISPSKNTPTKITYRIEEHTYSFYYIVVRFED